SIDVRALAGGSAVERSIADIITNVEEISRQQRVITQTLRQPGILDANARLIRMIVQRIINEAKFGDDQEFIELVETLGRLINVDQVSRNPDPAYPYPSSRIGAQVASSYGVPSYGVDPPDQYSPEP